MATERVRLIRHFYRSKTMNRRDRPGDPHGGVFILVNDKIISSEETVLSVEGAEMVWVKVSVVGMRDLYEARKVFSDSNSLPEGAK